MHFTLAQKVLFKHCDPAGIVFYPRYFEMINDAVEAMFGDLLGWPFEEIHRSAAVPTAAFKVEFHAPSRHGDQLELRLCILKLGGSSMTLRTEAWGADVHRFTAEQVLVCVNEGGRPQRWPSALVTKVKSVVETVQ